MKNEPEVLLKLTDLFPYINDFRHKDIFKDLSNIWEVVLRLNQYLLKYFENCESFVIENNAKGVINNTQIRFPGVFFETNGGKTVEVGSKTVMESGAYIKGPAIIGKNCQIRSNAYIRGDVIIGDNCVIGHGTEVKNSIIMNYTNVSHMNYIGDSIVGSNVNIGFLSALLTSRVDKGFIRLKIIDKEGKVMQKYAIPVKKFGSVIGDDSCLGANIFLSPGFVLMPKTQIINGKNLAKNLIWIGEKK